MFDLDWLGQLHPAPDEDDPQNMSLQIKSFASILPHFIEGGARYLVVGSTIERRDQLDRFISAIDATDVTVVLVKASPATVHDLAVWNDGRDIAEVAHEVLDHLGW